MAVKVSKCHSFGICKKGTSSVQYKPKLYINNLLIPPVETDDCFTYLGRHFDFKMSSNKHKEAAVNTINELFTTIDRLPLHPRNKLLLYKRYVLSKISWHLTVADLPITWVKNNIDNIASKFIRSWLYSLHKYTNFWSCDRWLFCRSRREKIQLETRFDLTRYCELSVQN